jgi:hypothetical protein
MNGVGTFADKFANLLKPRLAGIYGFESAAHEKAAVVDRKNQSIKKLFVPRLLVKRAINENATRGGTNRHRNRLETRSDKWNIEVDQVGCLAGLI